MPIPQNILELENEDYGVNGKPVLIDAYRILKRQWETGNRDRELVLHLLFLSWYGLVEPSFVFGEYSIENDRLQETFNQIFEYLEPQLNSDAELLFVIGLPAYMFPFILGDEKLWEARALEYKKKYRQLEPKGINPSIFLDRGAYGEYYGHQANVEGGF
jgi:hypothetical protein